jgi:hypothetical protein
MKTVMVRYKTKPDYADENAARVRAVFDELRASKPARFRYNTYRLEDGVSFVHIATLDGDGENPLFSIPAFDTFQKALKGQCVEPPVVTELATVDGYAARG